MLMLVEECIQNAASAFAKIFYDSTGPKDPIGPEQQEPWGYVHVLLTSNMMACYMYMYNNRVSEYSTTSHKAKEEKANRGPKAQFEPKYESLGLYEKGRSCCDSRSNGQCPAGDGQDAREQDFVRRCHDGRKRTSGGRMPQRILFGPRCMLLML